MADEKIYVGSGKERKFDTGGSIIRINICLTDILEGSGKEYVYTSDKTGKKYISLNVNSKKEPDKYDKTHSVSVDTYKPENKQDEMPF